MHAELIDFGFMYNAADMMSMYQVHHKDNAGIIFSLNLLRREIDIQFQLHITDPRLKFSQAVRGDGKERAKPKSLGKHNRYDNLRFRIPLAQLQVVHEIRSDDQKRVLLISLEAPPNFYRKTSQIEETHEGTASFWKDWDSWFRQTDIVYSPKELRSAPLTLKKSRSIIDIGESSTAPPLPCKKKLIVYRAMDHLSHCIRQFQERCAEIQRHTCSTAGLQHRDRTFRQLQAFD